MKEQSLHLLQLFSQIFHSKFESVHLHGEGGRKVFHHMFLSGRAETLTLLPVREAYNVNDLGGYILGK